MASHFSNLADRAEIPRNLPKRPLRHQCTRPLMIFLPPPLSLSLSLSLFFFLFLFVCRSRLCRFNQARDPREAARDLSSFFKQPRSAPLFVSGHETDRLAMLRRRYLAIRRECRNGSFRASFKEARPRADAAACMEAEQLDAPRDVR